MSNIATFMYNSHTVDISVTVLAQETTFTDELSMCIGKDGTLDASNDNTKPESNLYKLATC